MTRRKRKVRNLGNTLDLHGVRHSDVEGEVTQFLNQNWLSESDLEIVVGMSHRMREIVTGILDAYELDYTVGDHWETDRGKIRIRM